MYNLIILLKLRDSNNQAVRCSSLFLNGQIADDIIDPKLQLTAAFPLIVMVMQGRIRELKLTAAFPLIAMMMQG